MTDLDEFDDTSTFENKAGLADDMRFLASIPEVGTSRTFPSPSSILLLS